MDYSIGLDIGTTSVGFAVIDNDCNLVKKKGKNLLGVRLFDEGVAAQETRVFRTSRRRIVRRRNRIKLLRELIGEEVTKNDSEFFERLDNSFYLEEDKINVKSKNILFNDKNFKDKDFFKKYKTIYHLRNELLTKDEQKDIREVYLALHHIIKFRGHFLIEGKLDVKNSYIDDIKNLFAEVYKYYDIENENDINSEDLAGVIIDNVNDDSTKTEKVKNIKSYIKKLDLDKEADESLGSIVSLILGKDAELKKVYRDYEETDDKAKKIKLGSETDVEFIDSAVIPQCFIFEFIKNTYSSIILSEILNGETSISMAMVNKYVKHKSDLKALKEIYRTYDTKKNYYNIFRGNGGSSYSAYVGHFKGDNSENSDTEKGVDFVKDVVKKDLTKFRKNINDGDKNAIIIDKMLLDIENEVFLPKQRTTENISIPNQLHYNECEQILLKQGEYYPCLLENKDKILSILTFKIPYYVGPLNYNPNAEQDGKRQFAWATRRVENEKIYPWTFNDVIDKDTSAEKFIDRMRNKCTYIYKEETLPTNSLYLSEFNLYNELNKVTINGKQLDVDVKNKIVDSLFKKTNKVSKTAFEKKFTELTGIKVEASKGYQKETSFASSLTSYRDFTKIFNEINDTNVEMIEEIIYWLTVFNEKEIIGRKIRTKYPQVTDEQVQKCLNLKYSGWGRMSKKLINGLTTFYKGQELTILDIMRSTNKNFMEIINLEEYEFKQKLSTANDEELQELKPKDIQALQGSPAIKKGIWQSILIIKEVEKIMGEAPKTIYLEFARDDENKNAKVRTNSRYQTLDKCFKDLKVTTNEYNKKIVDDLKTVKDEKDNKKNLASEMVYLYFLQNGKCLYTGKPLNINELSNTCHVDHIIPRKLIKDDSIENKALVLSKENAKKSDDLTLSLEIREKQRGYWLALKTAGLMSGKKYYNLMRDEFKEEDVQGFIARQLVETRQISVHVKNLLENYYSARRTGTKVKTVKAGISSELRQTCELYKVRELNCFHHAHDAYLSAVIGTFVSAKFANSEDLRASVKYKSVLRADGNYIIKSFLNNEPLRDKDGVILWENDLEKVENMRKIFNYRDVLVSKKVEEDTGLFYNQNILAKGKGAIPINSRMIGKTELYGGYSGQNMARFMAISFETEGEHIVRIIGVPVAKNSLMKQGTLTETEFLQEYLNKKELDVDVNTVKILKKFSKYQEMIIFDSTFLFASVKEGNGAATLHRATDIVLADKYKKILYALNNKKAINRKDIKSGKTMYQQLTFDDLKELLYVLLDKAEKLYGINSSYYKKIRKIDFETLECSEKNKENLEYLILTLLNGLVRTKSKKIKDVKQCTFDTVNGEIKFSFGEYGTILKAVNNVKKCTLVTKSVTGFYEHREVLV